MLDPGEQLWLEAAVERWEATPVGNSLGSLRAFLSAAQPPSPSARAALLLELAAIDLERRWKRDRHRAPKLEQYVKWLAEDWPTIDDAPGELLVEERRARLAAGDPAPLAEYAARFPRAAPQVWSELAALEGSLSGAWATAPGAPSSLPSTDRWASWSHQDFRLLRMVGSGGISRVYTALQKSSQQAVAIKVLRKKYLGDPRAEARFRQEAHLAAQMQHPRIVDVHGLGRLPGGGVFLVMDLISGTDLRTRRSEGPVTADELRSIIQDTGAALQRAHALGVVHGDVTPGNLLYDARGRTWLTDFGMAVQLNDQGESPEPPPGGTPGYLAPELLTGDAGAINPAVDVYGLGATVFTLITGEAPAAQPPIHWPASIGAELAALRPWAERCLAPRPEDRFSTIAAAFQALPTPFA